jgi:hypothetical protein
LTEIYELDLDYDLANHIADPESWAVLRSENLPDELIQDEYIQKVYDWQKRHHRIHGKPASGSALEASFEDLALGEPLTAVGDLIQRLRERYARNQARVAIRSLGEVYQDDPLRVIEEMKRKARDLSKIVVGKGESWGIGDHERAMREYNKYLTRGQGPSFGFKELDEYFYGQRGLTFWLGAPKSMKTWVAFINGILANVLEGRRVEAASLELPAAEANMRLKCLAANVPWWKYLKGRLSEEDKIAMAEAEAVLSDCGGSYRIVSPPIGERRVEQIVQPALDGGADVLFIDQLQYLQDQTGTRLGDGNNTGSYWGVGDDLRGASHELPITVIHQFNRSVMNSDEMPSMQQAKGSSMVEEVGTLVLGLHANKDMRLSNLMHVGTLATRNYGLATWELGVQMTKGCKFEINEKVEDE